MKIGIDIRTLMDKNYSGVSEYTLNLLSEIFRLDNKNLYKLYYNSGRDISREIPRFDHPNARVVNTRYPNKIFNYALQRTIGCPKIDRMLGVDLFFMPHINFISLGQNCKKIITVHDLSFWRYPDFFSFRKNFWHKTLNVKNLLGKFDVIIAVSENTKRDIMELAGISEDKVKVIYSGLDSGYRRMDSQDPALREVKKKYGLPPEFILYLGTVEPRKNISGIIKAFSAVKDGSENRAKGAELKLVIAGAKGWKSKEIYEEAGRSKYKKDIIFLGYVDRADKAALYNLARVFVYPSFYEGFGFPPLEAMACGCPTIIGASSSLYEIARNQALTANPHSISELARALAELLKNDKLRDLMAEKAAAVGKSFRWEASAKQYLDIFNGNY